MIITSISMKFCRTGAAFLQGVPVRPNFNIQTLWFRTTAPLMAEPLKKKRRANPAMVKLREDRKRRSLQKQIEALEANVKQLKPLSECYIPLALKDELEKRTRDSVEISDEMAFQRQFLKKQWCDFKTKQHLSTIKKLDGMRYSQQKALDELRNESEELYQEAVQIDPNVIPFKTEAATETPPIDDYDSPDGDYKNISKVWT